MILIVIYSLKTTLSSRIGGGLRIHLKKTRQGNAYSGAKSNGSQSATRVVQLVDRVICLCFRAHEMRLGESINSRHRMMNILFLYIL